MSLAFEQKQQAVARLAENLDGAASAILADYRGLSVAQMTSLRGDAREQGVSLRVVKNTLAKRAVEGGRFAMLSEHLAGPVALAWSSDPVAAAKVLSDFAKDNEMLKIKVGAMDGALLDAGAIKSLAALPGRPELLAKLAGTMKAPLYKLVRTLGATPLTAIQVLVALKQRKERDS